MNSLAKRKVDRVGSLKMEIAKRRTIGGESEFLLTNRGGIGARRVNTRMEMMVNKEFQQME